MSVERKIAALSVGNEPCGARPRPNSPLTCISSRPKASPSDSKGQENARKCRAHVAAPAEDVSALTSASTLTSISDRGTMLA
eukprot:2354310-Amphidinium_carterae.2